MKAKLTLLTAAGLVLLAPALLAADAPPKPADRPDAPKCTPGQCQCGHPTGKPAGKTVMLTGSHIPQPVTKAGRVTDSADRVTMISQQDLARTGETNLAAALRKTMPAIR